ncbi:4-hydroxy-tetrahydrodipicolinate synthase [Candidatus Vidania fulgoroideae]|uniref:4-hydroxy-tetrahydrodipicolinate synthase n=1 Tax=Candidatus Vidania fulgoroideorum TaxID=881286 RepID=A0A975AEK9_9PROT|nr:4-hydroxy-tetrahydrodipicolinate synthase [Candidatus Vidania fulgoroideae]
MDLLILNIYITLRKVIVSIITPMRKNLKIRYSSIKRLVNMQLLNGNRNILVNATTSESTSLSSREKIEIIRYLSRTFKKEINLISGSCCNSTRKSIKLIEKLNKEKLESILQITPYYYNSSEEGVVNHFKAISLKSKIPIIVYNVPKRTGIDISSDCLKKIFKISNIIGIKDSSCNNKELVKKIKLCNDRGKIFLCGDDLQVFKLRKYNIDGVVSVLSNVFPLEIRKVLLCKKGYYFNNRIYKLIRNLSKYNNPLLIKWLLKKIRVSEEFFRLPLVKLNKKDKRKIKYYLKRYYNNFFKRIF